MAKPVKIREHFTDDAKYLLRLKQAIEKDSRPVEWTEEISALIDNLVVKLIQAPEKSRAGEVKRKAG